MVIRRVSEDVRRPLALRVSFDVALIQARSARTQVNVSTITAHEEDKNTEDTEFSFTPSLYDLRASVFQIYLPKGNFN